MKVNVITLTVVHPELNKPMETQIALNGTKIAYVSATRE
jgi:hypothetical protein